MITMEDYGREYFLRRSFREPFDVDGPVRPEPKSKVRWFSHLLPGKTVLDVGCGRGEQVRVMAGLGTELVVGIDWSYDGIDIARQFCRGLRNVRLYRRDARSFHPAIRFDVVTMFDFVEHLMEETAQVVYRLCAEEWLVPGGRLCVICPPKSKHVYHLYHQSRESLRRDIEAAGFEIEDLSAERSLRGGRIFVVGAKLKLPWPATFVEDCVRLWKKEPAS
jgi:2-polyprenyl-3-methyl-5-hydroxy-6-metoxy-1,4-benzoquinol methylase